MLDISHTHGTHQMQVCNICLIASQLYVNCSTATRLLHQSFFHSCGTSIGTDAKKIGLQIGNKLVSKNFLLKKFYPSGKRRLNTMGKHGSA